MKDGSLSPFFINKKSRIPIGIWLDAEEHLTKSFSIRICNVCNYKNNDLSLSDRQWVCPQCGTNHNRDHNAALNI
jgi:hypothetical protein